MIRYIFLTILMTSLSIMSPVSAQDDSCDTQQLSEAISEQVDNIEEGAYTDVEDAAEEINTLLTTYLDDCVDSDSVTTVNNEDVLFTVSVNQNVNIRSCSSTSCQSVGTARTRQDYDVVGEDNDWYEIVLDDGSTGFIASWLTVRAPDEVIDIYESHIDRTLNCGMTAVVSRSTSDNLDFAISGEAMDEVTVDIYRPNRTEPEPVYRQLDKTFIDTGDSYIHQIYSSSNWALGTYRLRLVRDNNSRIYEFELEEEGETTIFVYCE